MNNNFLFRTFQKNQLTSGNLELSSIWLHLNHRQRVSKDDIFNCQSSQTTRKRNIVLQKYKNADFYWENRAQYEFLLSYYFISREMKRSYSLFCDSGCSALYFGVSIRSWCQSSGAQAEVHPELRGFGIRGDEENGKWEIFKKH